MVFAGCTAPGEDTPGPLFGVCPQWLDGDSQAQTLEVPGSVTFAANQSVSHAGGNRSLDRFHVHFENIETDGVLEVRAFAVTDGRVLRFTDWRDADGTRTPTFLALDSSSGLVQVDIYLSDLAQGSTAQPTDIRIELTGQDGATGSMLVTATPGYRVCGAVF